MKKYLYSLIFAILMSCGDDYKNKQMWEQSSIVLNKAIIHRLRTGDTYQMYIYNGRTTEWYDVSYALYNKYEAGDSIHAIVLQLVTSKCDTIP